jgi:hypothetical protein
MYLRRAAEVLVRESCGEDWLLQPKILDMDSLEYRCMGFLQSLTLFFSS